MAKTISSFASALVGLVLLAEVTNSASGQSLTVKNGDLLAGFRKTGSHQANFEVVVNIGNITNFEALSAGSKINITNYVTQQLSDAFSDFNNLQWSVSAAFPGVSKWAGFPGSTIWYSLARTNVSSPAPAPPRAPVGSQQQTRQAMLSVGLGAAAIAANLGTSNIDNTRFLVREPINDPNNLSSFIGDVLSPSVGNFQSTLAFSVENTTPGTFSNPVANDLFQSCPMGTVDPFTGVTTGAAYVVGSFALNPDGTMTFTRASTNSVPPSPPPAPNLSITRLSTTTTISFLTTNSATYKLYYTNSAGLNAPVNSWPVLQQVVSGDGNIQSFTDTSTDLDRVYRVSAQ